MASSTLPTTLLLLALGANAAAAQVTPTIQRTSLAPSGVPAAATAAFESGMTSADYNFPARAATQFKQASEASPSWGIARVMNAVYAPGLTRDQRIAEMNRGVADAAAGSTAELLAALTYRERYVHGPVAARPITHALAEMVPGEPRYALLDALRGGLTEAERAVALRQVVTRFPEYGAAYNLLAYDLWRTGDQAGALQAAETQVRLAGDQPNPHDTYAELLQWAGRLDEARTHYRHALERAPEFVAAEMGLAEVEQLGGRGSAARAILQAALAKHTAPEDAGYLKRGLANSFLMDGDLAGAMRVLGELVREEQGRGEVGELHLRMALADAALGRGREVAAHLAQAGEVPDAEAALAYALAGQAARAREHADRFSARAAAGTNAVAQRNARTVSAFAQMAENDCARALETFRQAPADDMVSALGQSLCLDRTGSRAEAATVRARALAMRQTELEDHLGAVARGRMLRGR